MSAGAEAKDGVRAIAVAGLGAVSPAGWGVAALVQALESQAPLPIREWPRPGLPRPLRVRAVPVPTPRPPFLAHPRLRRSSAITHFAVGAALEAIGDDLGAVREGRCRLGIIFCLMAGCVVYSRRFYEEVWRDPATASPMLFPETVFNAPASHLATLLQTSAVNYTMVGDPGTFVQGLALAGQWLLDDRLDGCLVVGAEEADWIISNAFYPFQHGLILSEGAGALYLRKSTAPGLNLRAVTNSHCFGTARSRSAAAAAMRAELPAGTSNELLCDGVQNQPRLDAPDLKAWSDWPGARLSPKTVLGDGLMAGSAWQCVAACAAVAAGRFQAAHVSVVGANQQAIGARFARA